MLVIVSLLTVVSSSSPPYPQRSRHGGLPLQVGLQRGRGPVQASGGDEHLRPGLRHPQALRPGPHQRHAGVGAPHRALLQKDWTLQAPHAVALTQN